MPEWYRFDVTSALQELDSRPEGLTEPQAQERLRRYGPNELEERKGSSPLLVLAGQFTEVMVIVLLVAAAISFAVGETTDGIMILVIVILNAILGFTQEYRAERAMAALKKLAVPTVRVCRDGQLQEIDTGSWSPAMW